MNANRVRLAAPTPDFNRFADDQVLTAAQLNRLIDYLLDQQRGSRAQLLGSGIVCGLELSRQGASVTLSQGVGLSSDGDLMTVPEDRVYTRYRPFADAEAQYPLFRAGGQALPMWELHQAGSSEPGLRPLSQFNAATQPNGGGIGNVQALLYLEHYLEEFELCDAEDCDNRGPREVQRLRLLLLPRSDALLDPPRPSAFFELPLIEVPRVRLNSPDISRYDGNQGLSARFAAAIERLRSQLTAAFAEAANGAFGADIDALRVDGQGWGALLNNDARFAAGNNQRRAQYLYAFFRDLADAWHEWRDSLLDLGSDCLPDPARHPRHLLLGELGASPDPQRRHRWHPGPVHARDEQALANTRLLLRRMQQMLSFFNPPVFNSSNAIRATPSRSDGRPLGERAIPFYYNSSDQRPLFRSWDPQASRRRQHRFIRSYFASRYNPAAGADDSARDPWGYHRGGTDFIRIEGHLGQPVEVVQQRLDALKRDHNLAFQVLAVQLEDQPQRVRLPPRLRFPDLETLFHVYQSDIASNLREARSYNQDLRQELDAAQAAANAATLGTDANEAAGDLANAGVMLSSLNQSLSAASAAMPLSVMQFQQLSEAETTTFTAQLSATLTNAGSLGVATVNLLRPTRETPIQRLADGSRLRQFGLLKELFDKRRLRLRERSIFARFVSDNPGLEHLGGVAPGGTFVLVYAADDGEVLADFALPYYSTFDMSTLEPEQIEPEPTDPAAPRPLKPPYVLEVPPWGMLNRSPVFTLQGERVRGQVIRVQEGVSSGLTAFLNGISLARGGAVADIGGVVAGGGSGLDVFAGSGGRGAVVSGVNVADRQQELMLERIGQLRSEQAAILARIDQRIALTGDARRAAEIDAELAELVVQGTQLSGLLGDDASLGSGDREFVQVLAVTALAIQDDSARTLVADRFEAIATDQPNTILVGNLGGLAGVLRS